MFFEFSLIKKIVVIGALITLFARAQIFAGHGRPKSTFNTVHRNSTKKPLKKRNKHITVEAVPWDQTIPIVGSCILGILCGACFYYSGEEDSFQSGEFLCSVAAGGCVGIMCATCARGICTCKKKKR